MTHARSLLRKFNDSKSETDSWLLDTISKICKQKERPMEQHGFQFACTRKAAKHNHKLLAKFNYNFPDAIHAHPNSIISPGAEFRKPSTLHQLLHHHQDWEKIHSILEHGVEYPFQDSVLTDKQLRTEIPIMLDRGNYQSTKTEIRSKVLREAYKKEVSHGWQIPLTTECLSKLQGAPIILLDVALQLAVNEERKYVGKYRVTHDCSFKYSFDTSLNSAVNMELVPQCKYGKVLLRYLHQIHVARLNYHNTRIYQVKTDLDAAYRRLHVTPSIALKQISVIEKIAYISTRLPFGSSPAPSLYSIVSDIVFDFSNDILEDDHWNFHNLHSPNAHKFPSKIFYARCYPFRKCKNPASTSSPTYLFCRWVYRWRNGSLPRY